jgi:hypothetical protein
VEAAGKLTSQSKERSRQELGVIGILVIGNQSFTSLMNISSLSRDIAKHDTPTGRVQLREATEERGVQVAGQRPGASEDRRIRNG